MRKNLVLLLVSIFVFVSGYANAGNLVFALVPKAMNNPFFDLAKNFIPKNIKTLF